MTVFPGTPPLVPGYYQRLAVRVWTVYLQRPVHTPATEERMMTMAAVRDERGRYLPGNPGGPGNPHSRRVNELRVALLDAVTPDDIRQVVRRLITLAQGGDVAAARLLFDRCLGREDLQVIIEQAPASPQLVTPEQIALMMQRESQGPPLQEGGDDNDEEQ